MNLRLPPGLLALLLPAVAFSCGDDTSGTDDSTASTSATTDDATTVSDTDPTTTDTTTTDASTSDASTTAGTTDPVELPMIVNVDITENPNCVLSAYLEVETDVPTTIVVEMGATGEEQLALPFTSPLGTSHEIPILGMRAETEHAFTITVTAEGGGEATDDTLRFTTNALPDDFPPVEITVQDPGKVAPGVTIFDVARWNPSSDNEYGLILGTDARGEIIWYWRGDRRAQDVQPLTNGNLAVVLPPDAMREVSMMGDTVREWDDNSVATDSFHHDVIELPNHNLLFISSELRNIDGYEMGMTAYDVVGDVFVEMTPDGEVVDEWSAFDLYDPLVEIGAAFNSGFWNTHYADVAPGGTKDWTHGNAVVYDEADDALILSLRNIERITKIKRSTLEIVWDFGPTGGSMALVGGGEWMWHQHAPELQANGNILLFDNGVGRPLDPNRAPYSRAVEFAIDAGASEVTQVWEFIAPHAVILGDADRLANGNVLVCSGGQVTDPDLPVTDPTNNKFGDIFEVTGDADPEVVMQISIKDESAEPIGWTMYRTEKLPSLYQITE